MQQETTTAQSTENIENIENIEISIVSIEKEYISHYEWYEDYPKMLVRSEYSDIMLDKAAEEAYPELAKTLSEASSMRKRVMEEEKDNFLADATYDFMNDGEAFSTYISTLDVKMRRADSIAVSLIEDYNSDYGRSLNGLNYDTQSGKQLVLSDVVTDVSKIPELVEKEIMHRMGEEEPSEDSAVIDYFNNISQEDISWTLDYNGLTFWFAPGNIAPSNFGVQTATISFSEYSDLFNEKYTSVPDAYITGIPVDTWYFTDITDDEHADGIFVSGSFDADCRIYNSIEISTDTASYDDEIFAYGLDSYYVRTSDGKNYICIYALNGEYKDRDTDLRVFDLTDGKPELLGTSETDMICTGKNIFVLPSDADSLINSIK